MSLIQFSIEQRTAFLTLASPPLNILTLPMMREINQCLDDLGRQPSNGFQAIVIAAAPECTAFSTGISVEDHQPSTAYQTLQEFHAIYRNLRVLGKPVVGVVRGQAFGMGCELVAYCDLVIAVTTATFGQPEIRLGLYPPTASVLLPRIIGWRRATRMVLLSEVLDAAEAQRAGLVDYVVPQDQLPAKTEELLAILHGWSAPVLESARRALHTAYFHDIDAAMQAIEDQYLNQLMSYADVQEGLRAFREKRKPVWQHH
ncbi:enoyl-CoA hydratase/isomerase family protein [Chloracidobacterium validum]|uniref:Enoyl-CoA hydratase/isomerase family protein n=1 Tax=Chloracidobacterium validum TaxID=2821543 RepID=A0ABX8B638_9BACT|nr:enoyl-CoA hydratase/isomerase family protein [Chloracidobacterium validum]QUW02086.1 enoyl-CoA hydratase/isomerase family protein [Chloracidobacterium validum]